MLIHNLSGKKTLPAMHSVSLLSQGKASKDPELHPPVKVIVIFVSKTGLVTGE